MLECDCFYREINTINQFLYKDFLSKAIMAANVSVQIYIRKILFEDRDGLLLRKTDECHNLNKDSLELV